MRYKIEVMIFLRYQLRKGRKNWISWKKFKKIWSQNSNSLESSL